MRTDAILPTDLLLAVWRRSEIFCYNRNSLPCNLHHSDLPGVLTVVPVNFYQSHFSLLLRFWGGEAPTNKCKTMEMTQKVVVVCAVVFIRKFVVPTRLSSPSTVL